MIDQVHDYGLMCEAGRRAASAAILDHQQTDHTPRLVRAIREAAKDDVSGFGAGFIFTLAQRVR